MIPCIYQAGITDKMFHLLQIVNMLQYYVQSGDMVRILLYRIIDNFYLEEDCQFDFFC